MVSNPHVSLLHILAHISIKQGDWLSRTTCPHEDRIICPHPRPQGLLQYTVLVLILGLAVLKVLILVLEDQWTVLVPSLFYRKKQLITDTDKDFRPVMV